MEVLLKNSCETAPLSPTEGIPVKIAPGIYRLCVPLPFELSHINLWLLESDTGWSIIDTGFNYGETLAHWENVFRDFFKGKPVENIFLTHFHPDHVGLAGWLAVRTGVTPHMTVGEETMMRSLMDEAALDALYRPYYIEAGLDGQLLAEMLDRRMSYKKIIHTPPEKMITVRLGDTVTLGGRKWKILGGGGHSPEHACLYDPEADIFIAGDVVLPGITPNISFFPGNAPGHNPMADYFDTLENVEKQIPNTAFVLPSHGEPFYGLHTRIAEMRQHHAKRSEKVRQICAEPRTALEVMRILFAHRELSKADLFFALGETLAHLIYDEKKHLISVIKKENLNLYITLNK